MPVAVLRARLVRLLTVVPRAEGEGAVIGREPLLHVRAVVKRRGRALAIRALALRPLAALLADPSPYT